MFINGLAEGPLAFSIPGAPGRIAIALSTSVEGVLGALAIGSGSPIQIFLITRTGRFIVVRINHRNSLDVILTLV